MGDPRKIRAKFSKPSQPWKMARIEEERIIITEYGLKNKSEIWKLSSKMKAFANQAQKLIAATSVQAELERTQLLQRVHKLGLVKAGAKLDDVLGLTLKHFLERRLQTIVFRKGLAHTLKQARQYIAHEHISIGNQKITAPSYLVPIDEEPRISFIAASPLASTEHPARTAPKKKRPKRIMVRPKNKRRDRR